VSRRVVGRSKNASFVDRIWGLFASLKLAVIIFAVVALTSIIGTIIEQNAEPEKNLRVLSRLFGESAAPALYDLFERLWFMDMYHSWWFMTILLLFAINLVVCSVERLPKIMKLVKDPVKPLSEDHFKGFGIMREVVLKGRPEKTRDRVISAIKKNTGFNIAEAREENGFQLYTQRGSYTRLGVYITHFSILIILAGAIIGVIFGFKGFLPLQEGKTASTIETRKEKIIPLGFAVRCDDFDVDFYGNSDMPKDYKSWLTIIKDGKEVVRKIIRVNDPLTYEGVTFYQSSYGIVPSSGGDGIFRFKLTSKEGKTEEVNLKFGESFTIPGTEFTGKIEDFSPALAFDATTEKAYTYAEQMNNPAVLIDFSEKGKRKYSGWILKRYPNTWRLPNGHTVEFMDLWGIQYTGLQVRKDPGILLVYTGCITMAIGLFVAFFMSHRRIWVKLVEEKGNTRILIGATANKNRQSFERKIDRLAQSMSKTPGGGIG
jgi:cytochrome c biogenesis protein